MKHINSIGLLLLSATSLFGQVGVIQGHLVETGTTNPISFASISITNSHFGTAANGNGEFTIPIENALRQERLAISCIGYRARSLSIDSLLHLGPSTIIISILPDNAQLDAVIVQSSPPNPTEIVKQAIEAVKSNYYQQPFNLELFSTIQLNDTVTGKSFQVETVIEEYCTGYGPGGQQRFELREKRTSGDNPVAALDYGFWPSFEVRQADQLTNSHRGGIFNAEHHRHFVFEYAGVMRYESDTVFRINYYAPRPTAAITGYGIVPSYYKGTVYIATGTLAVVRHEVVTSSFRYHVIYRKVDGAYFPYYFSGERKQEFKLPGGKRTLISFNEIHVTRIALQQVQPLPEKTNEYDIRKVTYHPGFWDTYYPSRKGIR
ncbi:MAG: carboxypeptidase-like regulatory domain-containing protein [Cyclobacteriaceae bacterium]|nr:carboxypeptidase-like regulatory domain-containing protein [Cyclobacteriaceae bacterium]